MTNISHDAAQPNSPKTAGAQVLSAADLAALECELFGRATDAAPPAPAEPVAARAPDVAKLQLDIGQARKFLDALAPGAKRFWFVALCDDKDRRPRRPPPWGTGKRTTLDDAWPHIVAANRDGYGIFMTINETNETGRSAADVIAIRAIYHDDDTGRGVRDIDTGEAPSALPPPGITTSSSPDKGHGYWLTSGAIPVSEYTKYSRRMVQLGHDKNAVDASRISRLPGTYHLKKRAAPHLVTCKINIGQVLSKPTPEDLLAALPPAPVRTKTRVSASTALRAAAPTVEPNEAAAKLGLDADTVAEFQRELSEHPEPGKPAPDAARILSALVACGGSEYDPYYKIGMALHAATGGGDAGEAVWDAWSLDTCPDKFSADVNRYKWQTFSDERDGGIGLGTLIKFAKDQGWKDTINSFAPVNGPAGASGTWDEPDMSFLGGDVQAPPRFPVEMFGPIAPWIEEQAPAQGTTVDLLAGAILTASAGFMGSTRRVAAGPQFEQPISLWCLNVARSSAGKSAPLRVVQAAVDAIEAPAKARDATALMLHDEAKTVAAIAQKVWHDEAVKARKAKPPLPVPDMPFAARAPAAPMRQAMTFTGATLEAFFEMASQSPRGLFTLQDEIASFVGDFDRYGGNGADRANMLKAYDGASFDVRRKGRPPMAGKTLLSIFGSIQPEKLAPLLADGDDGFVARFLLFAPDAPPYAPVAQECIPDALQSIFGNLFSLQHGPDGAAIVCPLTAEALGAFEVWRRAHHAYRQRLTGKMASAAGKHDGMVLRIAAVLQHLWWAQNPTARAPDVIDAGAIRAACDFIENYQKPMLERVYDGASTPLESATGSMAKRIFVDRLSHVNEREVKRGGYWAGITKAHRPAAVAALLKAGWLREPPKTGDIGRPKGDYDVNPRIFDAT